MQSGPDAWSDLHERARDAIERAQTPDELQRARVEQLGRKSWITEALRSLGELPEDERREAGQALNRYKRELQQQLQAREEQLAASGSDGAAGALCDFSLPGRGASRGSLHPVSQMLRRARGIFVNMGYRVVEGPEIEYEYYNFDALNIPTWHPARAMHDTFYIQGDADERYGRPLLRTHTSPMQVRVMQSQPPPIFIVSPGRTYRADSDLTHTPMFHQLEGLAIDERITFADLKGTVQHFLARFFASENLQVRFRASYFPFTEPSAEVDLQCMECGGEGCRICKNSGWLEIMGCGMVHPRVLEMSGIDPARYSGFAFGMGMERMAMLAYGIEDMRLMYQGSLDFLRQY